MQNIGIFAVSKINNMYWYEDEIKQLESKAIYPKAKKKRVLFYGSSSIRMWNSLAIDFPEFDVVNQGFGGSTLAACCWFFSRVIPVWQPDVIVLYAGDNDLGDNRHPEEVFLNFKNMMALISESCSNIPVAFISVKQSRVRSYLYGSIEWTNGIIRDEIQRNYLNCTFVDIVEPMKKNGMIDQALFEPDGLHLSLKGYSVWKQALNHQFLNAIVEKK